MSIKEASITVLDYSKVTSKTLRKWLEKLGFNRYPIQYRLEDQTVKDPRYAHKYNPDGKRDIKGCEPTMMIVPYYHFGETMYLIRQSTLDKLLDALEASDPTEESLVEVKE